MKGHRSDSFHVGCNVECQYKGLSQFYPGKIQAVNDDGTYDIAYDDGDKEFCVSNDLIKAKVSHENIILSNPLVDNEIADENFVYDVKYKDGDVEKCIPKDPNKPPLGQAHQEKSLSVPHQGIFRTGTRVNARFGGGSKFFPGTIISFRNDTYDILYDDGDREFGVNGIFITKENDSNQYEAPPTFHNFAIGQNVHIKHVGSDHWYHGYIESKNLDGAILLRLDDTIFIKNE